MKITFLAVSLLKFFVLMINLPNQLWFIRVKMLRINFLKQFFKSLITVKKVMKKHFNKHLIMAEEEEENFQSSKTFWICQKLIEDEKVRDHCHITGK